jgi:hypothetical protein
MMRELAGPFVARKRPDGCADMRRVPPSFQGLGKTAIRDNWKRNNA